jgi:hypothetical protein
VPLRGIQPQPTPSIDAAKSTTIPDSRGKGQLASLRRPGYVHLDPVRSDKAVIHFVGGWISRSVSRHRRRQSSDVKLPRIGSGAEALDEHIGSSRKDD